MTNFLKVISSVFVVFLAIISMSSSAPVKPDSGSKTPQIPLIPTWLVRPFPIG